MKKNSIMSSFPAIIPLLVALLVVVSVVASVSGQASDAEASARTRFRLKFDGFDQYNYDPNNASEPVIRTKAGEVVGVREGNQEADGDSVVYAFRGIPYAADTSGGNRWRPPQDPQSWSEPRSASEWGAVCPQDDESKFNKVADLNGIATPVTFNHLPPSDPALMSEDCLVLNVFSPSLNETAKAPVMVYIHGGNSFAEGSGNAYPYQSIVRKDVVLVTINYRLGFLGYFAHPSLDATNFGLLDQIKALEWVQDNIEKFGGDPAKVTIFGESAGGTSVMALMVSPLSRGLFQGAISESSFMDYSINVTMTEGGRLGVAVGEALDIPSGAGQLEKLRSLPAKNLTNAMLILSANTTAIPYIFVDGSSMDSTIAEGFQSGSNHKVPFVVGSNSDEMTVFFEFGEALKAKASNPKEAPAAANFFPDTRERYEKFVEATFGGSAEKVLSLVPAAGDEEAIDAGIELATDLYFGFPAYFTAESMAQRNEDVYLYYFTQKPEGEAGEKLGAFHASELVYVFNDTEELGYFANPIANQELADAMVDYWTEFARKGNPNSKGLPRWERVTSTGDVAWNVLGPSIGTEPVPEAKKEMYGIMAPVNTALLNIGYWFNRNITEI